MWHWMEWLCARWHWSCSLKHLRRYPVYLSYVAWCDAGNPTCCSRRGAGAPARRVLALRIQSLDKHVLLTVVYNVTNHCPLFSDATSVVDAHIVLSFPSKFCMLCQKTRCFCSFWKKSSSLFLWLCRHNAKPSAASTVRPASPRMRISNPCEDSELD
jgi:hypothetical protein